MNLSIDILVEITCSKLSIEKHTLYAKTRKRESVIPRRIVMYLVYKHLNLSLSKIGSHLSKDHSTVLYHCRKLEEDMSIYKDFKNIVESIESEWIGIPMDNPFKYSLKLIKNLIEAIEGKSSLIEKVEVLSKAKDFLTVNNVSNHE